MYKLYQVLGIFYAYLLIQSSYRPHWPLNTYLRKYYKPEPSLQFIGEESPDSIEQPTG